MDRAFIFDVFGTLVNWRLGVAAVVREAFDARGLDTDPFAFADYWRSRYEPSMERIRSGGHGYVPLDVLHRANLDEALSAFGIGDVFDEAERAALNHAWEQLPPWPDVLAGLDRLRPIGLLAPCSNGSIALSVRLARFAGFQWDTIAGADLAQDYKPKHAVYLAAAHALGLKPEHVVMVAAHNSDLFAARAAGLGTAFFPRPLEHGEGQTIDLSAGDDWDYVADDLYDLATTIASQA